jgi:hypothetical protein
MVLFGLLLAGCSGAEEAPASPFHVEYAGETQGLGGRFTYKNQTYQGHAWSSATNPTGELLDVNGTSLAKWEQDPVSGTVSGVIDGKPFKIIKGALDTAGTHLLKTPAGEVLSALGTSVTYPAVESSVPSGAGFHLQTLSLFVGDATRTTQMDATNHFMTSSVTCKAAQVGKSDVSLDAFDKCGGAFYYYCYWEEVCSYTSSKIHWKTCC